MRYLKQMQQLWIWFLPIIPLLYLIEFYGLDQMVFGITNFTTTIPYQMVFGIANFVVFDGLVYNYAFKIWFEIMDVIKWVKWDFWRLRYEIK